MFYRVARRLMPPCVDYRSILFFNLRLGRHPVRARRCRVDLEIFEFNSIEDSLFRFMCASFPERNFRARMDCGNQRCHVALVANRMAGFGWVTTSPCHVSEIDFTLPLGTGRFYIYDCFVCPEFRGMGVYQTLLSKIVAVYGSQDRSDCFDTAWIGVEPDNVPSIKAIRRVGFQAAVRVRHLRVGRVCGLFGADRLAVLIGTPREANTSPSNG